MIDEVGYFEDNFTLRTPISSYENKLVGETILLTTVFAILNLSSPLYLYKAISELRCYRTISDIELDRNPF